MGIDRKTVKPRLKITGWCHYGGVVRDAAPLDWRISVEASFCLLVEWSISDPSLKINHFLIWIPAQMRWRLSDMVWTQQQKTERLRVIIIFHPQSLPPMPIWSTLSIAKVLVEKMLKLHVRVILSESPWNDGWAGNINPSDLTAWFTSYKRFVDRIRSYLRTWRWHSMLWNWAHKHDKTKTSMSGRLLLIPLKPNIREANLLFEHVSGMNRSFGTGLIIWYWSIFFYNQ